MYMCAKCKVYACSAGEKKALPKNCPMRNEPLLKEALSEYEKPENHDFYVTSSEIESLGYGQWVRVRETIEFCRRMGYRKLGLAFCRGLRKEAEIISASVFLPKTITSRFKPKVYFFYHSTV